MSAAVLTFDSARHEYRLPDGTRLPSVTEILRETGVSVDFDAIGDRSSATREAIELKRDLGSALHQDAHAFDDDDLDWSTVDPRVEPYLRAWATFRENSHLVPLTRERRVHHRGLRYAGTLDGIFLTTDGRRVLIDIKTGNPEDAGCRYQTAGYELAYLQDHDRQSDAIRERWAVQLMPEKRVPYSVTPYRDWEDIPTWQAIVATFYAQSARRGRTE